MSQDYLLAFVRPTVQKRLYVLPKCENLYPALKGTVNTGKDRFYLSTGVRMEGVEVQIHLLLTSALNGGERSAS
jgi:hypothetical protein